MPTVEDCYNCTQSCPQAALAHDYAKGRMCATKELTALLKKIDSGQLVEVVRGEWIRCGDGKDVPWMCSHCGKTTAHKYKTMYGKFCPNCGARMDGE